MNIKKIVVVGMGYVGIPIAAKFAEVGFDVVGINRSLEKVEKLNRGEYPLEGKEPGIAELIKKVVSSGKLKCTTEYSVCKDADAILVCVETPFDEKKCEPNYSSLKSACESVAKNMKKGQLIVIESTIAPGTMQKVVQPALEKESGLKAGSDFLLGHCPERVMPGRLLYNIENYNRVFGGINDEAKKVGVALYQKVTKGDVDPADMLTAEIVKTTENAYRSVQLAFANELGMICEKLGSNAFEVRKLVNKCPMNTYMPGTTRDVLIPGIGVGGHCIPKDYLLLMYGVKGIHSADLNKTAGDINKKMPLHAIGLLKEMVKDLKGKKIAVFGLAYIQNSDDTRNSPSFTLVEALKKAGATVAVTDPYIRKYEDAPLVNPEEAVKGADGLILATAHDDFKKYATEAELKKIKALMKTPAIVDGRNFFDKGLCTKLGFSFRGVGK
jgi:UDP-N-acetyl-D-mannosaminuronic acid dehydrogenase